MSKPVPFAELVRRVELQFNRGKCGNWKNRDYEDLSIDILRLTRVSISTATLKRIFGKVQTATKYLPQEATLVALKKYGGDNILPTEPLVETVQVASAQTVALSANRLWYYLVFLLLAFIAFSTYYYLNNAQKQTVFFDFEKIEGKNQATVYFRFNGKHLKDSLFFIPGYVPFTKTALKDSGDFSFFYERPGIFLARIKNRKGDVLGLKHVLIPTDNWAAICFYLDFDIRKQYYPISIVKDPESHSFHPKSPYLATCGIDTSKVIICEISNFIKTTTSADSFKFETRLKNTGYWPGVQCNQIQVRIWGERRMISFVFANPGCSHWITYRLNEKVANNIHADISQFVRDMSEFSKMNIDNIGKKVSLSINDSLIFSDSYKNSLGKLCGVSVQFTGSGYLNYLKIKDLSGKTIFNY